jgi:hypothetical protein
VFANCCAVLQAFLAQLEQQTAALSQEVTKLRLVEQQEMFLNPTAGEQAMQFLCVAHGSCCYCDIGAAKRFTLTYGSQQSMGRDMRHAMLMAMWKT